MSVWKIVLFMREMSAATTETIPKGTHARRLTVQYACPIMGKRREGFLMLTVRLLVALYGLAGADEAVDVVLRALSASQSPYGLRFAVPSEYEPAFAPLAERGGALDGCCVKLYDQACGLSAIPSVITDETHFLLLMGAHTFTEKWDSALFERLRRISERNALLTATLGDTASELPPRAYLPALSGEAADGNALISRGLPLVCSSAPVRTLLIDPALLLGDTEFLRGVRPELHTLSLCAYVSHRAVYALDTAPLAPVAPLPPRSLRVDTGALPGTTVARFAQQLGLSRAGGRSGAKVGMGLFYTPDAYPQKMPATLAALGRARSALGRLRESGSDMPLIVTAFIDLPAPDKPIPEYMLRFGFMGALERLPLLLYTGGSQERYMRSAFPNTRSYPDLLPARLNAQGITAWERFKRGKLRLLALTLEKHPEFSHIAWANVDLLKHPICPQAMPDFSGMTDDRVHIATVKGVPDGSFFIVPAKHMALLAQEALTTTLLDAEMKRGLSEQELWMRLSARYPELFTLHPMPAKHLLMLSAFDERLVCEETRALLRDPMPPIKMTAKGRHDDGGKTAKARIGKPRRASAHNNAG